MSSNARDVLRRYLEQRRELGESELVLDALSVDDVMRMLGARGADVGAPADHPRLHVQPGVAPAPEPVAETGDWRTILSASAPTEHAAPAAEPIATPTKPWDISDVGAPVGLIVGGDAPPATDGGYATLDELAQAVASCTRCPLHRGAKNPVPGEGNPNADLVVVGEAPGAEEDAQGRPFVGASGQLLTKILAAISLAREDVFICNVVKHRPPGNRNPEPDEVAACSPYLVRQLELLRPKVILTLGNFAVQTLLGTTLGISKLRGQVHRYHGIPLVATYHPAALLRNPTWKRPTWEDVQLARRILDRAR